MLFMMWCWLVPGTIYFKYDTVSSINHILILCIRYNLHAEKNRQMLLDEAKNWDVVISWHTYLQNLTKVVHIQY